MELESSNSFKLTQEWRVKEMTSRLPEASADGPDAEPVKGMKSERITQKDLQVPALGKTTSTA